MLPALKNNTAAGYMGPVKIELLKGEGQLPWYPCDKSKSDLKVRVGYKSKQIPWVARICPWDSSLPSPQGMADDKCTNCVFDVEKIHRSFPTTI